LERQAGHQIAGIVLHDGDFIPCGVMLNGKKACRFWDVDTLLGKLISNPSTLEHGAVAADAAAEPF